MLSPLKLAITFKTSNINESKAEKAVQKSLSAPIVSQNADIKVYLSTTHKEPGEGQFEKVYSNVTALLCLIFILVNKNIIQLNR